jgi:cobalt-zinc-cadmium efflux system membrane fusion protein
MESNVKARRPNPAVILVVIVAAAGAYYYLLGGRGRWPFGAPEPKTTTEAAPVASTATPTVDLSEKQLQTLAVGATGPHSFRVVKSAIGNVDFNQDRSTGVSTPYQGRILKVFVDLGDRVKRGDPLFTLESPDVMTAESTLIQTAGVRELADANLVRLRGATKLGGAAQKDLDQAISDQKTAEGNFNAARSALAIFGKTGAEIDQIVRTRKVDEALAVPSPADGVVSARVAATGLLVQPGGTPVTVSDDAQMSLNAFVVEADATRVEVGQKVEVRISSASNELFTGRVTTVSRSVDPNSHRLLVRALIDDPRHKLRAGMFATFEITLDKPEVSLAVPENGVVRQGDGSFTVWVRGQDNHHFTQRVVSTGVRQDGLVQILSGLNFGEIIVADGAVFVDNILNAGPSD